MSAHNTFISFFNATSETVEFNPSWKNGTGYLDGVCRQEALVGPGQVVKTVDDKNRKVLIIGTGEGPVAVFERYTAGQSGVIVCNFPWEIDREESGFGSSNLKQEHLEKMLVVDAMGVTRGTIDDVVVRA